MSFYSARSTQYALCYLFMMADGKITPEEQGRLDQLAQAQKLPASVQERIKNKFGSLLILEDGDNSEKISLAMINMLGAPQKNEFEDNLIQGRDIIDDTKYLQWQSLWQMLTLAYADTDYSEPEKKVIAALKNRWKIADDFSDEMLDTANTMLALAKQKEWWKTSGVSYDEITRRIAEIDKTIEHLYKCMDESITEAQIVEGR